MYCAGCDSNSQELFQYELERNRAKMSPSQRATHAPLTFICVAMPTRLFLLALLLSLAAARSFGGLTLPPLLYGTEGWENNVYFDNLSPSYYRDFEWEVSIARDPNASSHDLGHDIIGTAKQQDERLTFVPDKAIAATAVTIQVLDRDTAEVIASNRTTLVATNRSAGSGKTASLLVIGDSLTASGEHTGVLLDIAQNDSMRLQLVGTRGQSPTNRHEGRGGWTVKDYATAGRLGAFFRVHGVKVPPAGDPATSAPEEKYSIAGVADQSWVIWNVDVAADGSGVLGASCYPCPHGATPPPSGVLQSRSGRAGDANISFSAYTTGSLNPFWSDAVARLDVGEYLAAHKLPVPEYATVMLGDNVRPARFEPAISWSGY